eukprot:scaffold48939_cov35-Phaeocystis_antarctica.AAC.1
MRSDVRVAVSRGLDERAAGGCLAGVFRWKFVFRTLINHPCARIPVVGPQIDVPPLVVITVAASATASRSAGWSAWWEGPRTRRSTSSSASSSWSRARRRSSPPTRPRRARAALTRTPRGLRTVRAAGRTGILRRVRTCGTGPLARYVRRTRTSLGRAARTAYRDTTGVLGPGD